MGLRETMSEMAREYQNIIEQEKEARANNGVQSAVERERLKHAGALKLREAIKNGEIVRRP